MKKYWHPAYRATWNVQPKPSKNWKDWRAEVLGRMLATEKGRIELSSTAFHKIDWKGMRKKYGV